MSVYAIDIGKNMVEIEPNPNLLMNADFKSGIINQRGQTTYTGKTGSVTYTIDRWYCGRSPDSTLTVNDGYISVVLPENTSFGSYVEDDLNGSLTLSIKFKDEDVQSLSLNNYTQDEYGNLRYDFGIIDGLDFHVVKYVQYGDTEFNLWIGNPVDAETKTLNIEYIKIEKGSVFTGMPRFDYVKEMLLCQRYFLHLGPGWGNMYQARSDARVHSIYIPTNYPFARTPSLIALSDEETNEVYMSGNRITSTTGVTVPCNTFIAYNTQKFTRLEAPLNGTSQIGYGFALFKSKMALDAEKY